MSTAVTLLLLGSIVAVAYFEREYRHMGRALDADAAALRGFRWERPVLRGVAGEGNAADEIYAALANWKPLPHGARDALAQKVYFGSTLTTAESELIDAHAGTLRALRRATQQSWSRSELAPERGLAMRVPDYPRLVEAGLVLLADAQTRAADECLQASADLIRIGQDLVPAAPLEAASTSLQLTSYAARVIARCAARADAASLRRASHELRVVASHPAPIGSSIELEELASAMDLRERAALTDKPSPLAVGLALVERPQLMAAWSSHESPARFRRISAEHYPDSFEEWQREQNYHPRSSAALRRVQDDMQNQALLRMLGIGLSTLAERAYRGSLPNAPIGLRDPALSDPFRSQPLSYRVESAVPELTLWSVGRDFRDDGGSDEWSGDALRDVTLHFPLPARDTRTRAL